MKISLLHPSRGRPTKARVTALEWLSKAGDVEVEHIFSIDNDDPKFNQYTHVDDLISRDNKSVVQATNAAAEYCHGDILIYLSDDFKCPDNWGELVVKEFENENRPLVLKVDDCLQKFSTGIITIPIMNRDLYNKLGWFWHPEYKSMFCDEHLYWTCHRLGAIKNCEHLKFPHYHYSNPDVNKKGEWDDTYRNSEANWNQGLATFRKHKSLGFPI